MLLAHLALFSFFDGAGVGAAIAAEVTGGKWQKGPPKRKKPRVIKWSEFAEAEERAAALAAALAETSAPIGAIPDAGAESEGDSLEEEEDALITALVLARVIH